MTNHYCCTFFFQMLCVCIALPACIISAGITSKHFMTFETYFCPPNNISFHNFSHMTIKYPKCEKYIVTVDSGQQIFNHYGDEYCGNIQCSDKKSHINADYGYIDRPKLNQVAVGIFGLSATYICLCLFCWLSSNSASMSLLNLRMSFDDYEIV